MIIDKSNIDKYIDGTRLHCSRKGITSIESIPDHVTHLFCESNKLTSLPKLPSGLLRLECDNNKLTSLPYLPDSLVNLWCRNNQLASYPENSTDEQWMIEHNKWINRINIINKINDHR